MELIGRRESGRQAHGRESSRMKKSELTTHPCLGQPGIWARQQGSRCKGKGAVGVVTIL